MVEPRERWGYGIRRGTSVFHILRAANSAREAQALELSYPVGDAVAALAELGFPSMQSGRFGPPEQHGAYNYVDVWRLRTIWEPVHIGEERGVASCSCWTTQCTWSMRRWAKSR